MTSVQDKVHEHLLQVVGYLQSATNPTATTTTLNLEDDPKSSDANIAVAVAVAADVAAPDNTENSAADAANEQQTTKAVEQPATEDQTANEPPTSTAANEPPTSTAANAVNEPPETPSSTPADNPIENLDNFLKDNDEGKACAIADPLLTDAIKAFVEIPKISFANQGRMCALLSTLCKGSPPNRRAILAAHGGMVGKIKQLLNNPKTSRRCCALMSTLVWEEKNREILFQEKILHTLSKCLHSPVLKTRAFAANSIAGLCVGDVHRSQVAAEAGVVPGLTALLENPKPEPGSEQELCVLSSLNALWMIGANRDVSTQIMLHGGITHMFHILANLDLPSQSTDTSPAKGTQQLARNVTACLCTVCYNTTVRCLLWTLLEQHETGLRKLVGLMGVAEFETSFHASAIAALLMLGEQNVRALMHAGAVAALGKFCSEQNPLLQDAKFNMNKSELTGLNPLFAAEYKEQLMFIAFVCARFSSSDTRIGGRALGGLPYVREVSKWILPLAFHSDPQISRLSRVALSNLSYSPFLTVSTLQSWLATLKLSDENRKAASDVLASLDLDLETLFDITIEENLLRDQILSLPLAPGVCLKLWSAVCKERTSLRNALTNCKMEINPPDDMDQDLGDLDERATVATAVATPAATHAQVFLSYSWAQKSTVKLIRALLERHKITCWMDEGKMKGGDQLFKSIDDGISNAKVVVCCISDAYATSQNCTREILLAADRKRLILPVIVGQSSMWPPQGDMGPILAGKLYIDMHTPELYSDNEIHLMAAVRTALL